MLGTDPIGVEPLAVVTADEVNADPNPYADVFSNPETNLVFLVEIEAFPPPSS